MSRSFMFSSLIILLLLTGACAVKPAPQHTLADASYTGAISVALYPYVPRPEQFRENLEQVWSTEHPQITLQFIDWDCYESDPPGDLDVFVFDAIYFDQFLASGYLTAIAPGEVEKSEDFLEYALEGCRVGGQNYAIPQLGCGSALFYRKSDKDLEQAETLDAVVSALGECTYSSRVPPEGEGLMVDLSGGTTCACLYLNALEQNYGHYSPQPPLAPDSKLIDPWSIQNVRKLLRMASAENADAYVKGHPYQRAEWFSQGYGRAFIGYTESMSVMSPEARDLVAFKLMPLASREGKQVSLFYSDVIGINSSIIDAGKRRAALELANLMASRDLMIASIGPTESDPVPQYLMPVRHSIFAVMEKHYPLYGEMYQMVTSGNPGLFRIGPDSRDWLDKLKGSIKEEIYAGACK